MNADLVSVLISKEVGIAAAAIVAVLYFAGMIPVRGNRRLARVVAWRRVLPMVPIALGIGLAFLPGVLPDGPWASRLLLGVWVGFVAAHGRKVFTRLAIEKFGADGEKVER